MKRVDPAFRHVSPGIHGSCPVTRPMRPVIRGMCPVMSRNIGHYRFMTGHTCWMTGHYQPLCPVMSLMGPIMWLVCPVIEDMCPKPWLNGWPACRGRATRCPMTAAIPGMPFEEMLYRVQGALKINQNRLAEMLGCSPRTVYRYYARGGQLSPRSCATLATACHPHDRALAAHVAERGGHTLESLGLERPVAPVAPAAAPPPLPAGPHLADSIVCAAAEALDASPRTMRPALRAALERMVALRMTAAEVLEALAPPVARAYAGKRPAAKGP